MSAAKDFPGLYEYRYLPGLAKFILDEHIREYAKEQLRLARQYDVPLLKFIAHYSEPELIEIGVKAASEVLECLAANKAAELIQLSLEKWVNDAIEFIGKYDVVAEDITLLNHVRGKGLKHFAYLFTRDSMQQHELLNEIDDFLLASTTASANTFIDMLKGRLAEEEQFRSKLSDALPAFIYVYDIGSNREIRSNNKLKDILHYAAEDLSDKSENFYQEIIDPADWKKEHPRHPPGSK